jgi:hypothetical protein
MKRTSIIEPQRVVDVEMKRRERFGYMLINVPLLTLLLDCSDCYWN